MKTTCPYCGVGCGIEARCSDNGLQVVAGDKTHPANQGRLCVKGSSLHETLDPDGRLRYPMAGGERVSWDSALSDIAAGFSETIEKHGPDSVAFYLSGQLLTEDYYVANKLMKGFIGSANLDTNSRLCMASAVVGYKRAFGSDTVPCSYEDLEQADLLVLVGSNAAWNHPVLFQRMQAAKQARPDMRVVVIDPRRTATCELADLHLPIRSGTDTLLFNGLLKWLAEYDALNSDYIDRHTEHFDEALKAARETVPEWAELALQLGVDIEDLLRFFRLYAAHERSVTFYSQGVNQSASGVDNSNAIINCHLATGRIGKPGMGPFSITGQPNAMGGREVGGLANQLAAHMDFAPEDVQRLKRFWDSDHVADKPGLKAVEMFQAMERGEIKAVWIMGTNPVVSLPDAHQVRRALKRCPLVVVSDCVAPTDTGQFAHYLLPATGWSEKNGTVTNSERRISRQRGLLPPSGEARHDWQIICDFARRLGFGNAFGYRHQVEIFREHASLSGFENDGTRDFDISALAKISPEQYEALAPVQWPVTDRAPEGTARMFRDGRFFTPSGRARFVPIQPRTAVQQTSTETPVVMNTGRIRDQWHTMTRTGNATRLFLHRAEPFVELNPLDAEVHQINEGDLVRLSNSLGEYVGRARIDQGLRKGQVFVPMHWTEQFSGEALMGGLIEPVVDPLSGQPELKHGTVALRPMAPRWQGWLLSRETLDMQALSLDYWSRIPQQHSTRYHLASEHAVTDWLRWCEEHLGEIGFWWQDTVFEGFRAAGVKHGRLDWVLLVLPYEQFPEPEWLDQCFAPGADLPEFQRQLLGGSAPGEDAKGAMVCSCYQVGKRQIEQARENGCGTVEQLGEALKCGTNCGSCVPELKALLAD